MAKKSTPAAGKPAAATEKKATAPVAAGKASTASKGIKVRATQIGYYEHKLRRVDDVFVIENEDAFSDRWMERVDKNTPERVSPTSPELAERKPAGPSSDDDVLGEG